jgi:putative chitinase
VLHLADGKHRFGIHSDSAIAAFLGQLVVESEGLEKVEENLHYTTAARLREIFPSLFVQGGHRAEDYVRNAKGLSKLRYKGFHGRGLIQLTWEDAYVAAGQALGADFAAAARAAVGTLLCGAVGVLVLCAIQGLPAGG